jgi:fermentation-respiration switch protein FrsA (DUF1100 family)
MIPLPVESAPSIPGMETIWLKTGFGKVEAWFLPLAADRPLSPAPAVIFGHGNGEIIDYWPRQLRMFSRMGIGLLLVEYPGYGRSAGSPSQDSITEAFVSAYDVLTSRKDVDASRIIFLGRSLGGGALCALAQKRPSAALILMSAFTSARSFAKRYLAPSFLVRDPFDNLAVVKNYFNPVLIIHGKRDAIISFSHGKKLHQAAKKGEMITYNAGHNDCPPDWDVFWKDVEGFLLKNNIISR